MWLIPHPQNHQLFDDSQFAVSTQEQTAIIADSRIRSRVGLPRQDRPCQDFHSLRRRRPSSNTPIQNDHRAISSKVR